MNTKKTAAIALFAAIISSGITYIVVNQQRGITTGQPNQPDINNICQNYANDNMSTLDADLVHDMTESYRANQWLFINTNNRTKTTNDAYSIWFDLETLKKFLYHIEKITKAHENSVTNDKLGVRIYYAAYPGEKEMEKYPDLKATVLNPDIANYGGLHTLVMIPTIMDSKGQMADFNPLDKDTYANGLVKVEKYGKNHPDAIPNNTAALSGTASRDTGSRNHGVLYPPTGVAAPLGF